MKWKSRYAKLFFFTLVALPVSLSACSRPSSEAPQPGNDKKIAIKTEVRQYPEKLPVPQYPGSTVKTVESQGATIRVTLLTKDSPDKCASYFKEWCNRNGWVEKTNLEPEKESKRTGLIAKDFEYQTAAAYFYSQRYDEAEKRFMSIARDKSSPWHELAPYLAARALIRKASILQENKDKSTLQRAREILLSVSKDPEAGSLQTDSHKLLSLTQCRMQDIPVLASAVRNGGKELGPAVDNLTKTIDRALSAGDHPAKGFSEVPVRLLADDMVDWAITFHSRDDKAFRNAITKWKSKKTIPWLMASLSLVEPRDAELDTLLQAASQVKPSSPGYLTVCYHVIRLQMEIGKPELARALLDKLQTAKMSNTNRNLLCELNARMARNIAELAKFCTIRPAAVFDSPDVDLPQEMVEGKTPHLPPPVFDSRTIRIVNEKLPISLMKEFALAGSLPRHLKEDVVSAVWVRAVLLNSDTVAKQMGDQLSKLRPDFASLIDSYNSARSVEDRHFAAVFTILKYPGVRPYATGGLLRKAALNSVDEMRNNWWGDPRGPEAKEIEPIEDEYYEENPPLQRGDLPALESPPFLSAEQREQAVKEVKALSGTGDTATYFLKETLALCKRSPDDKRLPEMLHQAILASRHTDTSAEASELSKQAYALLRKRFPKNPWTVKTKAWY